MYVGLLVAIGVASLIHSLRPVFATSEPMGVVLGATVIFAVGVVDDLRELSPPGKLAGTVLASTILYFLGVTLFYFRIPFAGFVVLGPDYTPLLTALWVAVMSNAINLIDGLDGLAAGIVTIASGAFFVYSWRLHDLGLLTPDNVLAEQVYLGLRTMNGLAVTEVDTEMTGAWEKSGWAKLRTGRVTLTAEGWLRLDSLAAALTAVRSG